jgi:CHAD domain-containing protein/CYTH domain-containing protein
VHTDPGVIDRPAEEGARVVALALLADCDLAAGRLESGGDAEALHDFRVGLRRMRTILRSFRPWLSDTVRRKAEKKLARLARATNAARDAEVQLAFVGEQREAVGERQRAGLDFLEARLHARRRAGSPSHERLVARYRRTSAKLAARLQRFEGRLDGAHRGPSLGAALAGLVAGELDDLCARLGRVAGAADEHAIHKARIAGKRLRYLLEPLRGNPHGDARAAVKELKRLQDVLGDLHDAHVLSREIAAALVDAAAERARRLHAAYQDGATRARVRADLAASPRSGVLAMVRLVRERRDALFGELDGTWRKGGGLDALAAEVRGVAGALEARAGGHVAAERRWLVTAVPSRFEDAPAVEVDQGWLPGELVRERVRRVRDGERETFWRALRHGGAGQLDAEEETSREVFEALWPLTEDHRLGVRRRSVEDGGAAWEIDEVQGRDLVLARVRLPPGGDAAVPEWLQPCVVREVTDDPGYGDEALAAALPQRDAVPADGSPPRDGDAAAQREERSGAP